MTKLKIAHRFPPANIKSNGDASDQLSNEPRNYSKSSNSFFVVYLFEKEEIVL